MIAPVVVTDRRTSRLHLPTALLPAFGHGAAFALYLLLSAVWLRPLTWEMTDHVTGPGDPLTTAWRLVWPAQWLTQRSTPFWDTNVMYPATQAFARDELALGQSLIAGPLFFISHNALFAYNVTLLVTLTLSGFTTYCLAWHFVQNRTASVIAGIIVAFAPYHLAQLDHAGLLAVMWLPLVILFLDRTLRNRRWQDGVLVGLFAFLQALSAGYYAYWTALVILLYVGYMFAFRRHCISFSGLIQIAIPLLVALVALVPIIVPFQQSAAHDGFARPLHEVEYWSARPQTWIAATPSNMLYGPFVGRYAWTWSTEMYLFPGAVALALSAIAIVTPQRKRARWFALSLAVCGFALTLGPTLHLARRDHGWFPLPYALLYRFVPGGDALRAPVRAAPIAMIGIGLLAALGWVHLRAFLRLRHARRIIVVTITTMVIGTLLVEYAIVPLPTVAVPQLSDGDRSVVQWLRAQPPSIIAVFPDIRAPVSMALATTNQHRFINGDAEILPNGTKALFTILRDFPSPEGISALSALDVDFVVFDRHAYPERDWHALADRLPQSEPTLNLVATLPDATIYRIHRTSDRYTALRDAIPNDATVFIAPALRDDTTYLDRVLAAHVLRGHHVRGELDSGWISEPTPPQRDERFAFGIFGAGDALPDWCDPSAIVWSDGQLSAYRARSG